MLGIGVDIEDISRFKTKTLEGDYHFLKRVYTNRELDYCFKDKNFASHLAVRFCAKEAIVKAMSRIYNGVISYNKIEILNHENGSPYVILHIEELKKYKIFISLSHEKDKAIAYVIVE